MIRAQATAINIHAADDARTHEAAVIEATTDPRVVLVDGVAHRVREIVPCAVTGLYVCPWHPDGGNHPMVGGV